MNREELHKLFEYEGGKLFWAVRKRKITIGAEAGCDWTDPKRAGAKPRRQIRWCKKLYLRSRLVWVFHYGAIPDGLQIDHVNGDPSDDRVENLRLATNTENNWNKGLTQQNSSGAKGVRYLAHLKSRPWSARAKVNGKQFNLGYFSTKKEAKSAYDEFIHSACGKFSNTGSSK
jgi:hypothetical protein